MSVDLATRASSVVEKLQHRRWLLLPTLGMVALAVYMTHSKALQSFFEPITYGAIHVDSPQVYTRERLINDRLSQEIWLTRQMDKLTGASALISGRMTSKNSDTLTVRIGDDDQRKEPQDDAQSQPLDNIKGSGLDGTSELSIQSFDEFRIRSAMRDQIRQMILETQLDDRHDLYGNSIYVLKFDAAIIPGNNTHAKAFIEVGFRPLPIRELLSDTEPGSKIRSYLALYLDRADNPKLAALRDLYNNWIRDLDWRLNDRVGKDFDALMESKWYQTDVLRLVNYLKNHGKSEESHFGSDTSPIRDQASAVLDLLNGPGFNTDRGGALLSNIVRTNSILWPHLADFLAIRAMQSVLSVTDRDVFVSRIQDNLVAGQSSHFLWAGQFSKYVSFEVNLTKNFLSPPRFQVREDLYQGDVVDRSCKIKSDQYVFVDAIRNDQYLVFAPSKVDWKLASYDPRWAAPGFVINDQIFSLMQAKGRVRNILADEELKQMPDQNSVFDKTCSEIYPFFIPSGFFNFIERIGGYDTYNYAVLPREEPKAIARRRLERTKHNLEVAEQGSGLTSEADAEFELEGVITNSGVSGYGVAGRDGGESRFGWVIDPSTVSGAFLGSREAATSVQRSLTALLSVPAWWGELTLEIETGWLDDEGKKINQVDVTPDPIETRVVLPTSFDGLNSIVAGIERRKPSIFETDFDQYFVNACTDVTLLIPGYRLWRNSVVTLGSQTAEEIRVMPNMDGISATFRPVRVPTFDADEQGAIPVKLRVWTSEGAAELAKPIKIGIADDDRAKGSCQ